MTSKFVWIYEGKQLSSLIESQGKTLAGILYNICTNQLTSNNTLHSPSGEHIYESLQKDDLILFLRFENRVRDPLQDIMTNPKAALTTLTGFVIGVKVAKHPQLTIEVMCAKTKRTGIGKTLLNDIENYSTEKNIDMIGLLATPISESFYKKYGFKKQGMMGIEPLYVKQLGGKRKIAHNRTTRRKSRSS
jgi:N-acetylglutamate synthase-like GNAT family acetyltransferase